MQRVFHRSALVGIVTIFCGGFLPVTAYGITQSELFVRFAVTGEQVPAAIIQGSLALPTALQLVVYEEVDQYPVTNQAHAPRKETSVTQGQVQDLRGYLERRILETTRRIDWLTTQEDLNKQVLLGPNVVIGYRSLGPDIRNQFDALRSDISALQSTGGTNVDLSFVDTSGNLKAGSVSLANLDTALRQSLNDKLSAAGGVVSGSLLLPDESSMLQLAGSAVFGGAATYNGSTAFNGAVNFSGQVSLGNTDVDGTIDLSNAVVAGTDALIFEGGTADSKETTLTITDPTADRVLTLPDASGMLALTSDIDGLLATAANLADLADAAVARTNLGLGSAATQSSASFVAASNNLSDLGSATTARTNLGLGSAATVASSNFLATGNNLSDLTSVATARTNLGLAIGANVQAYDAALASIAGLVTSANKGIYATASDTYATYTLTAAGLALLDDADATAQQTTLGIAIGANVQAYDADLTTYAGITPSANMQTLLGSADYATVRTNLGLGTAALAASTDFQAADADLTTYAGITPSANIQTLLGSADYATARTNLGLGSMASQAANNVSITGGSVTGITDLAVADGGTGAGTFTANGVLYGNNTSALQATAAGTSGQLLVASALTVPTFVSLSGDATLSDSGVLAIVGNAVALTDDTAGNYVAAVASGTGLTGGSAGAEGANLTLAVDQTFSPTWTGGQTFSPSGTNDVTVNLDGDSTLFQLFASATDLSAGISTEITNSAAAGTIAVVGQVMGLVGTANVTGANTIYGISFDDVIPAANNTFIALDFGTGLTDILRYNGTQLISGTGIVQSAAISGSYAGITGVGTVATGVWNGTDIAVADGGTGASDNTTARSNLGLAIGSDIQAYDADLTTYAGITPSANMQTLLGSADYATARTNLGLGTAATAAATDFQAADVDLTTYAGITPSANMQTLLGSADYATVRTNLGLGTAALAASTDFQAADADLTTYAGITPSANIQTLLGSADYATARTNLGLAIGTNVQAYDADLTTYAGITPSANIQTLLGSADYATARTNLGLGTAATTAATDYIAAANNLSELTNAATARTNLGLGSAATAASTDFQAADADLTTYAGITPSANIQTLLGSADYATARTNLGLGSIATQASNSISITGGSVTGITDLTVADGGTGASDSSTARTNLGLGSISTQASSSVTISGGTINGTTIGDSTPSTGAFTNLSATGTIGLGAWSTYTAANGSNNNINVSTATLVIFSGPTSAFTISGIGGGADGRMLILVNPTAQSMSITNADTNSSAGNRIATFTGGTLTTTASGTFTLVYNSANSLWFVTAWTP